jgi:hypothetical protein
LSHVPASAQTDVSAVDLLEQIANIINANKQTRGTAGSERSDESRSSYLAMNNKTASIQHGASPGFSGLVSQEQEAQGALYRLARRELLARDGRGGLSEERSNSLQSPHMPDGVAEASEASLLHAWLQAQLHGVVPELGAAINDENARALETMRLRALAYSLAESEEGVRVLSSLANGRFGTNGAPASPSQPTFPPREKQQPRTSAPNASPAYFAASFPAKTAPVTTSEPPSQAAPGLTPELIAKLQAFLADHASGAQAANSRPASTPAGASSYATSPSQVQTSSLRTPGLATPFGTHPQLSSIAAKALDVTRAISAGRTRTREIVVEPEHRFFVLPIERSLKDPVDVSPPTARVTSWLSRFPTSYGSTATNACPSDAHISRAQYHSNATIGNGRAQHLQFPSPSSMGSPMGPMQSLGAAFSGSNTMASPSGGFTPSSLPVMSGGGYANMPPTYAPAIGMSPRGPTLAELARLPVEKWPGSIAAAVAAAAEFDARVSNRFASASSPPPPSLSSFSSFSPRGPGSSTAQPMASPSQAQPNLSDVQKVLLEISQKLSSLPRGVQ